MFDERFFVGKTLVNLINALTATSKNFDRNSPAKFTCFLSQGSMGGLSNKKGTSVIFRLLLWQALHNLLYYSVLWSTIAGILLWLHKYVDVLRKLHNCLAEFSRYNFPTMPEKKFYRLKIFLFFQNTLSKFHQFHLFLWLISFFTFFFSIVSLTIKWFKMYGILEQVKGVNVYATPKNKISNNIYWNKSIGKKL